MRTKILFVTHALESVYGAATSLRLLLENYTGIDADLLVPRSFRNPRDLAAAAAPFPSVRQVHEISMPVDLGLVGIRRSAADKAHGMAHWLGWQRDRSRYKRLVAEKAYDMVHLNSSVLHQMMLPGVPMVFHIREIIPGPQAPAVAKLASASGLIFIDAATRQPFARHEGSMNAVTLNNPIDMSDVQGRAGVLRHPRLGPATTVFSMIGQIYEIKGVDLVIDAFRRGAGNDALLLIAGDGPAAYVARCRALAGDDPRIVFWGEEKDIKRVYAATDFVVRGDPQPCVGRTVYEGLYAGCHVIIPGPAAPGLIFEAEQFHDSIIFYDAGDRDALAARFAACTGKKAGARAFRSNIADYVRSFDDFLHRSLARRRAQ